ncbi:basic proline-rich protein-like [Dunckerocampus dactyliophorus]|uniref:basic proline-rich protein-like n=1 Tax=Dunckerocampus dactyliophorus TaxID=161453 RepID=UPI002406CECA|nr:basic proline-rich protein-like [Dunckerocampus dactyliophorus]
MVKKVMATCWQTETGKRREPTQCALRWRGTASHHRACSAPHSQAEPPPPESHRAHRGGQHQDKPPKSQPTEPSPPGKPARGRRLPIPTRNRVPAGRKTANPETGERSHPTRTPEHYPGTRPGGGKDVDSSPAKHKDRRRKTPKRPAEHHTLADPAPGHMLPPLHPGPQFPRARPSPTPRPRSVQGKHRKLPLPAQAPASTGPNGPP